MIDRHRLILNLAYKYLQQRGVQIMLHNPKNPRYTDQITLELLLTPEEQAEAKEITDYLDWKGPS